MQCMGLLLIFLRDVSGTATMMRQRSLEFLKEAGS